VEPATGVVADRAHFRVRVVAAAFSGLSPLARHQLI
jgi:stress-induced morphogen